MASGELIETELRECQSIGRQAKRGGNFANPGSEDIRQITQDLQFAYVSYPSRNLQPCARLSRNPSHPQWPEGSDEKRRGKRLLLGRDRGYPIDATIGVSTVTLFRKSRVKEYNLKIHVLTREGKGAMVMKATESSIHCSNERSNDNNHLHNTCTNHFRLFVTTQYPVPPSASSHFSCLQRRSYQLTR